MILLSEVAEKVRNEIRSWPGCMNHVPVFHCVQPVEDAREGDERLLTEILGIAVGLVYSGNNRPRVTVAGDRRTIRISVSCPGGNPELRMADWQSMVDKAAMWSPEIEFIEEGIVIRLNLPASEPDPPVDLEALREETGLEPEDALMILRGFMERSRVHMEILKSITGSDCEERYRAAHSLKGAGKTMRAPELAAAARLVEVALRKDGSAEPDLSPLAEAWQRIERWYEEAGI